MMKKTPEEILNAIAQAVYDRKGANILALDVKGLSSITDYILIAEGNVDRHVIAIAKAVIDALHDLGEDPARTEGLQTGDWIVLDFTSIMVHLFMPGLRERYALEKLWETSKIVDLNINVSTVENGYGSE